MQAQRVNIAIASTEFGASNNKLRRMANGNGELEATFYIGVGYAVPTVTGHEWERSAQTLRD